MFAGIITLSALFTVRLFILVISGVVAGETTVNAVPKLELTGATIFVLVKL